MIPREKTWFIFTTCTLLLIVEVKLQSGRTYDTSEWIPVTPTALKATTSKDVEQTASDRVLSLDAPAQKFFPDEEYEYRKRRPNQVQQFLRESPATKAVEHPRPRKLKHPSEYKFETPPPPPSINQPQINYYNGQNMSPYLYELSTPSRASKPVMQQAQQSYSVPVQQVPNQNPVVNSYVAVPNINPQVPAPNAPNLYEQYQLPFNASFYKSLNPASLNNEFYQAINSNNPNVQTKLQSNIPQQSRSVLNKPTSLPAIEQETVQLVYVPVENLKASQPATQNTENIYKQVNVPKQEPLLSPQASQNSNFKPLDQPRHEALVYNPPYLQQSQQQSQLIYQPVDTPKQEKHASLEGSLENKQHRLENIQQDFLQQALQAHKLQQQLQDDINPLKQEVFTTTPRPNRKPHQPPLAVFMESQEKAEISDVLDILRDAKSISVQDIVTSESPKIFVGPSNLDSPNGYTKFPLPYLNNINGNRIERKIDQLPFFVAPVSYKAPPGYAKIPLPSPHVGSVVVSVPVTTSTTPEPILLPQNQVNPFRYTTGYSPIDPPTSSRPVQDYLNNYDTSGQGRIRYQSTPAPQATESPLIPPVRDIFDSQYAPPRPNVYYTQQNNQQTYRDNVPTLDIYRPQPQENIYSSSQENAKRDPNTVRPEENSYEISQLPNVNPLELAINEFELHQINNQFEQSHKKVKHSTTRRPPSKSDYEDNQTVSSTRASVSRGRHTYETEPKTERTVSKGRVRGRGRSTTSRTVTTTSTTPVPIENDRYTILEEFVTRDYARNPSTEGYGRFSAEVETDAPRRSSTSSNRNSYLLEQGAEVRRPQANDDYRISQPTLDDQKLPQTELTDNNQQTLLDDTRPQTQSDTIQLQVNKLETPGTKSVTLDVNEPNTFLQKNAEIENIPASVYSLGQPQTYDSTAFDFDISKNSQEPTRLLYENIQGNENVNTDISETRRPLQEQTRATHSHRFSPDVVSYENREPNQQLRPQKRPKYQEYDINDNNEPEAKQEFQSEIQRPSSEIADQVLEEQKPQQQSVNDPTGFLENLYQPNFDETYLSLQDQAVRSLLVPNLLAPSPKQQIHSVSNSKEIISSTEAVVDHLSSTEAEVITTTRATRTRGRGRTRLPTTSSTVTSTPKRTTGRRRPVSRTSTESIVSSTEYSSREDTERSSSNTKQNFRTRGRPVHNEISDRISTTENEIRAFKEPQLEGGFEILNREPPQSYMQFEHDIDEQQIITINPNLNQESEVKEYHQFYSLPPQTTTERQQYILEYENTRPQPTPIVDIQVTKLVPEEVQRNPDVITKPTEVEHYVRYNNANIRSGGILNNNKPTTTTKVPTTKPRVRTRGRSRFATTTKTTTRPVTRISTSSPLRSTTQEVEEQENYGFIRQPANIQRNIQAQNSVQPSLRNDEPVHFVGEIRPKYSPRKTTLPPVEELESAESPRPKIRARTRAPPRKSSSTYRQSDNDVNISKSSEQVTRRTGNTRGRVRGSTHYKAQDYQKRESEDEDVANQNYPVNFLQKLDVSSPASTTAGFKITVDPLDEDVDDQSPHPSIYRPKFVAKPDGWSNPNGLPVEDKPFLTKPEDIVSTELSEDTVSTAEPQALSFVQTTENNDELYTQFTDSEVDTVMLNLEKIKTSPSEKISTTVEPTESPSTKQAGRRKGAWKLIRQRPVDPLEVSESQNYQSVLNVFSSIEKVDPYTKSKSSLEQFNTDTDSYEKQPINIEKHKYNNFKQEINSFNDPNLENQSFEAARDVEEVVTIVSDDPVSTEQVTAINVDDLLSTTPSTLKTQENIFDTIYEMFGIFNKPGDKKNETAIAATDNPDQESSATTIVNPVFPEEITEEPSITTPEKVHEKIGNKEENNNDATETTEKFLTSTIEEKHSTKPYEVEPWEMRAVKTSTSTEISHETEICYKGRCVKSKDKKKHI